MQERLSCLKRTGKKTTGNHKHKRRKRGEEEEEEEEGRRKKEGGRRKKEQGRRKKEEPEGGEEKDREGTGDGDSCQGINTCITAPAGCIALALIFLRTNCEAVAARVAIPQNLFHLERLRPDFALLRIVAKNLILWDQIEATNDWLDRQTPQFLSELATASTASASASSADIDWLLVTQTKANLVAGACLALGLRFAGTSNEAARDLLITRLLSFRDAPRSDAHVALMASKPAPDDVDAITLETCQSTVALALGMVMAGTGALSVPPGPPRFKGQKVPGLQGDLAALRTLRSLRKKGSLETGEPCPSNVITN
eukprot:Skav236415  [mRNA]  locus=scaffold4540:48230:59570:- [translate_table: standard]